ncbi:MAG: hypothetical protein J6W67_09005, partial [Lentisphaeria bacterium]|nr:hypothetical protein [Lentisphaeria bacterium]
GKIGKSIFLALFPIWGDDAGKAGKLLFARKEVFPLSPRPSHPFKKSEKTFLFTFTCLCRKQSLFFAIYPCGMFNYGV